ncbi:hypothetical protein ACVWXM_002252 [Bradyrhizobium sp. GM7.3]
MQRSFVDPPSKPRAGRNEGIKSRRRDRCSNEAVISSVRLVRSGAYAPALPSASIRAIVGWERRGTISASGVTIRLTSCPPQTRAISPRLIVCRRRYAAATRDEDDRLPQQSCAGKRGIPPRCCFRDVLFAWPHARLSAELRSRGRNAAGEATRDLMYARRLQRSADRANALAASSSEAFSARRS